MSKKSKKKNQAQQPELVEPTEPTEATEAVHGADEPVSCDCKERTLEGMSLLKLVSQTGELTSTWYKLVDKLVEELKEWNNLNTVT